jgi:hypothetical protein
MNIIYIIAYYLDVIFPFITLLIMVISKKKFCFLDNILFGYLLTQTILNIISTIIALNPGPNGNHVIYYINSLLSLMTMSFFYRKLFNDNKVAKKNISLVLALFYISVGYLLFIPESFLSYTSYTLAANALAIIIYSLLGLLHLLKIQDEMPLHKSKEFYFIMGLLLYYGTSFIIFLAHNYLAELIPLQVNYLWMYHNIFFAIACIVWIKSFFINNGYQNNNSNNNSSFYI